MQVWTGCVETGSSVRGYEILSHYCSVICFGEFLHHLVVFPDQSWIEVSEVSEVSVRLVSLPHLLLLSVGASFVGGFPLPEGILVFTASIYSFL